MQWLWWCLGIAVFIIVLILLIALICFFREMKLPENLVYPYVKLGAKLFGRFDLEETSPIEAIQKCKIPVVFVHGDTDAFVPFEMSQRLFDICPFAKKKLIKIPGAGHGLAYPVGREEYINALKETNEEWELKFLQIFNTLHHFAPKYNRRLNFVVDMRLN